MRTASWRTASTTCVSVRSSVAFLGGSVDGALDVAQTLVSRPRSRSGALPRTRDKLEGLVENRAMLVENRAMNETEDLHEYLDGVAYPASRADLVSHARERGAGENVLGRLSNMDDRQYESQEAVDAAFSFEGDTTIEMGHVTVYDQ